MKHVHIVSGWISDVTHFFFVCLFASVAFKHLNETLYYSHGNGASFLK